MALYCQLRNDVGPLHNNNDCYVVDSYIVEVFSLIHQYLLLIPLDQKCFPYYRNKTLFCFHWLKVVFLKSYIYIFFACYKMDMYNLYTSSKTYRIILNCSFDLNFKVLV